MAIRVPRYDGPQVESTNIPGVRFSDGGASPEAYGAGIARGLGAIGEAAYRIGMEQKQKADDASLLAFKNRMSAVETELLYDPERGVYSRQGSDSFTAEQDTLSEWDKRQGEAVAALPRHLQDRALAIADGMRTNARQGIMRHVLQQTEVYRDQQADAMVAGATNAVVQNFRDEARVGEELANIDTAITLKMRGAPADAVEAAQARARSAALSGLVERALQLDPFEADAALQKYRGALAADHLVSLEGKLAPLKEALEMDGVVQAIFSGAPTQAVVPPARGEPAPEVRAAIEAAAVKHGVPAEYLFALAEQESSFNPRALGAVVPGKGRAAGIMQYMPETAREQGIDPYDVSQAVDAAARQFRARMDREGPAFAIAAHFAGEGGAAAVVKRGETAENPKTARYVAEVTGRAMRWRGGAVDAAQAAPAVAAVVGPPATLGDALSRLRQDPRAENPFWRKKAEQAVRSEYAVREADRADRERVALERMRTAVSGAGAGAASLSKVLSPDDLALAQAQGWDDLLQAKLDRQRTGVLVRTDPVVYDTFARMSVEDPERFASKATIFELWKAEGSLATADLARLQDAWVEANTPDKASAAQARRKVESGLINEGLVKLGWTGKADKENAANFGLAVAQARQAWRDSNPGREPDREQDRAIVAGVVQSFLDPERGGAERGRRARALSGFALTMTAAERQMVREQLVLGGVANPSDQQIAAYWAEFNASRGNGG